MGEGALAQLAHEVPDLILLDYVLPGMNGIETCQRIHRLPDCGDIPVIFLTAIRDTDEKVRALEAGAVDYVTKPIHAAEVLARVRTHLRMALLQRELAEELAMRREAEELLRDSLDRAFIVVGADGGIRFSTRLAQTLLARYFPDLGRGRLPAGLVARMKGESGPASPPASGARGPGSPARRRFPGRRRAGADQPGIRRAGPVARAGTDTARGRGPLLDQTSEKWGCDPKNTAEFDSLDSGQFRHPAPRAKRPPAGRGPAGQPGESPHGSTFIFSSISER